MQLLENWRLLGEAANRIPKAFRFQQGAIEWNKRTRNIFTHEYDDLNLDIVWRIATVHLPPLKITLQKIVSSK